MKYLKLFEEKSNEYYTEINVDEWQISVDDDDHKVPFKDIEVSRIIALVDPWKITQNSHNTPLIGNNVRGDSPIYFNIYKTDDDWYYLYYNRDEIINGEKEDVEHYYRCDQFDGILQCLEDLKRGKLS